MRLLITGGAGYNGSHTAHRLSELGHQIVIVDNLYSGFSWAIPPGAEFIEGDVGNADWLKGIMNRGRFDGLLHFAAHVEVAESVENPEKYYRNNVVASLGVFSGAREAGIRNVIFSSTAAVYGQPKQNLVVEDTILNPINPYGSSKMMCERILQDVCAASNSKMNRVILRYFNAAGAKRDLSLGQATPRATHLIKVACEAGLGVRQSMSIYGTDYETRDGTCLRDYIHIEDLAQAHVDALNYLDGGGRSDLFNVGYGDLYSVREVIGTLKRISGRDFEVIEKPRRPGDPEALGAKNEKVKRVLGWKPQFNDLDLICQTAFDWETKLRSGKLPR